MDIRPYHPSFKNTCLEIFSSNLPTYFSIEEFDQFSDWLDNNAVDEGYYVACNGNNQIIGCGGIFVNHEELTAGMAWGMVHKDFHFKGYGELLIRYRLEAILK